MAKLDLDKLVFQSLDKGDLGHAGCLVFETLARTPRFCQKYYSNPFSHNYLHGGLKNLTDQSLRASYKARPFQTTKHTRPRTKPHTSRVRPLRFDPRSPEQTRLGRPMTRISEKLQLAERFSGVETLNTV